VVTNYIKGAAPAVGDWTATISSGATSWLSFVGSGSGSGIDTPESLKIKVEEYTAGAPVRTGVITVTAGRLKQEITIIQNLLRKVELDISDVELRFEADVSSIAAQQLRVEWESAALTVAAKIINPTDPDAANYPVALGGYTKGLVFATAPFTSGTSLTDADGIIDNGGLRILNINPIPDATLATFEERRTILEFTLSSGPTTMTKAVLLRQFDYAIVVTNDYERNSPELVHSTPINCQFGTTYAFTVKSNAEWEFVPTGNAISNLNVSALTEEPNVRTGGDQFFAKMGTSASLNSTFTFRSKEAGQFADLVVPVNLYHNQPNTYIAHPGQTLRIPIEKAIRAWKNDPDLNMDLTTLMTSRTANLIWQDSPGLITGVSLSGNEVVVTVSSNTALLTGGGANAVVDFRINGRTYWSWLVWVLAAGDDPGAATAAVGRYTTERGTYEVMDRNLGARSATHNGNYAFGLMYQWGRKDPFPGARDFSNNPRQIYNSGGTELVEGTSAGVQKVAVTAGGPSTGESNYMRYATYSPRVLLYNDQGLYGDWYSYNNVTTTGPVHRTDRWGEQIKSEFDPCPDGWKVPAEPHFIRALMPTNPFSTTTGSLRYNAQFVDGVAGTSIGHFPAAGVRYMLDGGDLSRAGVLYSWTSYILVSGLVAGSSWATPDYVTTSAAALSCAMSVRCVKIW